MKIPKQYIDRFSSALRKDIAEFRIRAGFSRIRAGFSRIRDGFSLIRAGFSRIRAGFSLIRAGFSRIRAGFSRIREKCRILNRPDSNRIKLTINFFCRKNVYINIWDFIPFLYLSYVKAFLEIVLYIFCTFSTFSPLLMHLFH